MPRWGLGPVFAFEWLTTSRRWQTYALRALFLLVLLAAIAVVWWGQVGNLRRPANRQTSLQEYAQFGEELSIGFIGTELALVLLAAPAAAAGAVCLDKQRGNLTHLLVTDLSSAEIIGGKLGTRLAPVLGLIAASLPVLYLCSWMGGIDPEATFAAFLVVIGVAVFGCT